MSAKSAGRGARRSARGRARPSFNFGIRDHWKNVWRAAGAGAAVVCLTVLAGPRLEMTTLSYDFGSATNDAAMTHVFALRNAGDADLSIRAVTPDCESCTRARLDRTEIEPGGVAALTVEFDPAGLTGVVTRAVLLQSNDPEKPRQVVTFSAALFEAPVTNSLTVQPRRIIFQAGGAPETRIVFVSPVGATPVALLDVIPPTTNLACQIYEEPGRRGYRVYVRKTGGLAQNDEGNLVLRTSDAARPEIAVRVWIENSTSAR